jgi:hypothetical protein
MRDGAYAGKIYRHIHEKLSAVKGPSGLAELRATREAAP